MINFSVIGINHNHIYGQVGCLLAAGATLVDFYAPEDDLAAQFQARFDQARRVADKRQILEDAKIQLVVSAGVPSDRAPLGLEVMQHGKDYMTDKPGATTLAQLTEVRRVQKETGRIYSICFSERFENRSTVQAGERVKAGAIGRVIQTVGLGPHRLNLPTRPGWFFKRQCTGGILTDIASHQFDQFLYFTGSTQAEIVASEVANRAHPQYPELEDFGDVLVRSEHAGGYIRVDWFTPGGLDTWGDGRLTVLGTEGYIECRKYTDLSRRDGPDQLFLVDNKGMQQIDCRGIALPYGGQLIEDVLNRTETAMPQAHCFLAMELALTAQARADRLQAGEAARGWA